MACGEALILLLVLGGSALHGALLGYSAAFLRLGASGRLCGLVQRGGRGEHNLVFKR